MKHHRRSKRLVASALCALVMTPAAAKASDVRFASPSGNIVCTINAFVAACQIREYVASFTARPGDCDGDWGNYFFVLARGDAQLGCLSNEDSRPTNTLGYGDTVAFPQLSCTSAITGVTCTNSEGRGFSVRRAEQRIF